MQYRIIFLFVLLSTLAFAQTDVEISFLTEDDSVKSITRNKRDSIHNIYVKSFPDHFFIWPVIKRRTLDVETKSLKTPGHKIFFRPNNSVSMGFGFYVFELAFELALAVPIQEESKIRYGTSEASDIQLNALGKYWGIDVYRQKYKGFYLNDSFVPIPKDQPFPQRSDIVTRNFGVSGMYTFNRNKFSFRSSYNFAERQLYSKGSWFVTGTINSFRMDGDSVLLSIENRDSFSAHAEFANLRYTTFGIAPGYSYNLIYQKFFLNVTLGIGPAHNWTYIKKTSGEERNNVSINSISVVRLGIGYNADHFFGGIGFVSQSRNLKIEDFRVTNSSTLFKLIVGYRFKEFGVLKKRGVDFIPFKI